MKSMKTGAIVILTCALVIILAGGATAGKLQQELVQQSTVEQVIKRGILRVGMSTFVPWAMKDKTGKLVGFEIDVATRLAADMGVKIEFIPTKWAGIIPALLTGKFDVVIGGMSVRPDRNLKVNFSIPYDYAGQSLVANKKLAADFAKLKDFDRADVVISARLGSTAADAAKKLLPKAQMRLFDDEAQVIQEVVNGRAHAAVASSNIRTDYLCRFWEHSPGNPLDSPSEKVILTPSIILITGSAFPKLEGGWLSVNTTGLKPKNGRVC